MSERNLTHERQLAFLERQKAKALSEIGAQEVATVAVPKTDKSGKVVLASDGFPELVDKRVLKRDLVAKDHDDRIAKFKRERGIA